MGNSILHDLSGYKHQHQPDHCQLIMRQPYRSGQPCIHSDHPWLGFKLNLWISGF